MNNITFVTGGARSGKSRRGLELAQPFGRKAFIATAVAFDDEMRRRISLHQVERDASFVTIEEPEDLAGAIRSVPSGTDVVLLDCLTVWVGNLMHRHPECGEEFPQIEAFLDVLRRPPCRMIVVSNEVGMGIVPENALARRFRDIAGRLNAAVAALADKVVLMISGIPVVIKPSARRVNA